MAKCEVFIEFDRENRTYHSGDEVTGTVVVQVNQDVSCNELAVEHFWQTHGRGNKDTGDRARTVLYQGEWRAGETARFPFRFLAPVGPATYRGNYLNVDHYVAARVDLPWAFDPKCQEEFLLVPTGPAYSAGKEVSQTEIQKLGGLTKAVPIPLAIVLIVLGLICLFPFGVILIPVGLYLLFVGLRNSFAEKKIGQVDFHLERTEVLPGEQIPLRLKIRPARTAEHNGITAKLIGQERVTSGSGTNSSTYTHTLYEETIQLAEPGSYSPQSPLDLPVSITVPADAAYSFFASDNHILWRIDLRVDVPRWPDWVHTQALLVRPFLSSPATAADADLQRPPRVETLAVEPIEAEPDAIEAEPLATSDERWKSSFEVQTPSEPPPQRIVPAPASANRPTPESIAAPLLAMLAQIAATDRFGGRREAKVKELAGRVFDCPLDVKDVSHTFGYVDDRAFREGRTVQGTLAGSAQEISVLFRANRNAELDGLRRGNRFETRCMIIGWDDLYKRAELQEA